MTERHGDILKRILKEKHLKQDDFAISMGFTRGYLQQLFLKKEFKEDLTNKICDKLGIDKVQYFSIGETKPILEAEKKNHVVSAHPAIEALQHKIEGLHQVIKLLTEEQCLMRKEIRELQDFKRESLMKQYNR